MGYLEREYAIACLELTNTPKEAEALYENLLNFSNGLDQESMNFFNHPRISLDDKKQVIKNVVEKGLLQDFLFVLLDNHRFGNILVIKDEYRKLLDEMSKEVTGVVYSKVPLSSDLMVKISNSLMKKTNKKVNLTNEIDDSIIGGFRIEYETNIIDNTINSKINDMVSKIKE